MIQALTLIQNDFNLTAVQQADKIVDMVKPMKSKVMPAFPGSCVRRPPDLG